MVDKRIIEQVLSDQYEELRGLQGMRIDKG